MTIKVIPYIGIFSYYFNFRMRTTCTKIIIIEILFTIGIPIECTTRVRKLKWSKFFLYEGFRESKNTRYTVLSHYTEMAGSSYLLSRAKPIYTRKEFHSTEQVTDCYSNVNADKNLCLVP